MKGNLRTFHISMSKWSWPSDQIPKSNEVVDINMSKPTVLDKVKEGQDEFNKERAKSSAVQVGVSKCTRS